MKKVISFVLVLTLVLGLFSGLSFQSAADLPASGKCGENVTYTFDSATGTLVISGSGRMTDYSISGSPFYYQTVIKTVVVQSGVTSIGSNAFGGCSSLTSVTIGNSVTSIGDYAFRGCSGLTSVTIPDSVTSIGSDAFSGCSSLTSITIPDSVTDFGFGAFSGCSGLISVTIGNSVTSISDNAFGGCSGLTSVTIGNSVTSIGDNAFHGCSGLTRVDITSIETWCNISFGGNYGTIDDSNPLYYAHNLYLNGNLITDLIIPTSVTNISPGVFRGCSSLTSITIPDSVTSIGYSAFYGCSGLTSITIPDSVTSIGNYAFYGCSGLTSITIGNSVTNIGKYAFCSCSGLTNITIPNSVTRIGDSAFFGCSRLTTAGPLGSGCDYQFCWSTSIPDFAFSGCSSLTSISIPDSVTSIGDYAFYGCSGLTNITIPDSVTSIAGYAFYGCSGLTNITIPNSVTSIGENAFRGCSDLTSITIPNSVTSIGNGAFQKCGLTSINIPNSVTRIGSSAFYSCSALTTVIIPNSVTSISDYAFDNCRNLSSVSIPDSILSIGKESFEYCSSLKSITIPNSVTSIGNDAFSECYSLSSIDIQGVSCKIYDSSKTIPVNATIIINGSKNVYDYAIKYKRKYICNHVEEIDDATEPTCTKSGLTEGSHCRACNTVINKQNVTGTPLGHDYKLIITAPTCTEKGYTTYTCSRCSQMYKSDYINELGHNYDKISGFAATCTQAGKEDTFICSRCRDTYGGNSIAPLGHNYKSCNVIQKATPSKQGKITTSTCSVCGNEGETQPISSPKEIVLSTNSFTYSGKQCKPAVTVKDSAGKVIDSYHYTVAYSNNTNAGTARVTVTFKGDYYEGSMSKTFKIVPKKLTNCYLDNTFTYTGKAITPVPYYYKTVVQTFDGEQYTEKALTYFKKGTEYTIAVSGKHTQVGTYTVVIRFCGNYTGTVKKSIQIRPKPVTKSNTKPYSETSIKISWNKVAGVSGYSVFRYNIQKSKWERYKNTTATSMIVPRINASYTDVWLRIWTYKKVGGKVYYNESAKAHDDFEYTKPGKPIVKLVNTDFGNFVMKFNRVAWHQTQLSDNKAFSNKGENICVTYRNYNSKVTATGWGSVKKYYVRTREYYYDKNNKLIVGPWSDIKTITTY